MRLPYAPTSAPPPTSPSDTTAAIYDRIAARRKPRPLIPLDLTLLHSPPVADGYNSFVGALRTQTVLDQALLELSICRIAVLNAAVYEWNAHAPLAVKAGLGRRALEACWGMSVEEVRGGDWRKGLTEKEGVVLAYTDEMTKDIRVSESVFGRLRALFSEREIVELTACIGGYNCVSRILVALDVGENNAQAMRSVEEVVEGVGAVAGNS